MKKGIGIAALIGAALLALLATRRRSYGTGSVGADQGDAGSDDVLTIQINKSAEAYQ